MNQDIFYQAPPEEDAKPEPTIEKQDAPVAPEKQDSSEDEEDDDEVEVTEKKKKKKRGKRNKKKQDGGGSEFESLDLVQN